LGQNKGADSGRQAKNKYDLQENVSNPVLAPAQTMNFNRAMAHRIAQFGFRDRGLDRQHNPTLHHVEPKTNSPLLSENIISGSFKFTPG
jgi:hypothetical protein